MFFTQTVGVRVAVLPGGVHDLDLAGDAVLTTLDAEISAPLVRPTEGSTALTTATIATIAAMVSMMVVIALSMTPLLQRRAGGACRRYSRRCADRCCGSYSSFTSASSWRRIDDCLVGRWRAARARRHRAR